jgi:ABC-type lipoprotein export system ATPase subunit
MVTHDLHLAAYAHTHIELKDGRVLSITSKEENP